MSHPSPHPGKIVCIGRNYAAHARELGNEVPEAPILFLKPPSSLLASGGTVVLPAITQDVQHEVELVVQIGLGGANIPEAEALAHVAGYAVGLDLTARDLQSEAKKKGLPWTLAKGLDTFAPLGEFAEASVVPDPQALRLRCTVNGETRQDGQTADMLHSVASLIAYVSSVMTLEPGDLLFTGTPEGVSPLEDGDEVVAEIPGLPVLRVRAQRTG